MKMLHFCLLFPSLLLAGADASRENVTEFLEATLPEKWEPWPPDIPESMILRPVHPLLVDSVPIGPDSQLHATEIADLYDVLFEFNRLWSKQRWMGTIAMQNPVDAWSLQELIFDRRPDVIVETGTMNGGGALFYASLMKMYEFMAPDGTASPGGAGANSNSSTSAAGPSQLSSSPSFRPRIITVGNLPLDDASYGWVRDGELAFGTCEANQALCDNARTAQRSPLWKQMVSFIRGDCLSDEVWDQVQQKLAEFRKQKADLKVMVILDSTHHYLHVRKELALYSRLVTSGQYLLVQDTHLDKLRNMRQPGSNWEGAHAAIREWFRYSDFATQSFRVDKRREYFIYTQHKDGYLLRM
ncbi:unnamed protein product [Amoebophrya sp. A25]|nr:unnamed protein product [Amoebophrya sp. A25]|eukprot:GSA25T00003136001.1